MQHWIDTSLLDVAIFLEIPLSVKQSRTSNRFHSPRTLMAHSKQRDNLADQYFPNKSQNRA